MLEAAENFRNELIRGFLGKEVLGAFSYGFSGHTGHISPMYEAKCAHVTYVWG